MARFEVAAHRFCDLSEPGYGVALLNDGKYGHSAHGNVLGISLLRSPMHPDPLADEGEHSFTYGLFPHEGDWTEAGVTRETFDLNSPLLAAKGSPDRGTPERPDSDFGLLRDVGGVGLAPGSLKKGEDGDGLILRLYEPHDARGESVLRFAREIESAERVNLLEEAQEEGPPSVIERDALHLTVRPFEVQTLRIGLRKAG